MTIRELRILPPLAIARLGAAPHPMDNYDVELHPGDPLGYRQLRPATTFELNPHSGKITTAFVPESLHFTEDGKARPVAPFLEVWAVTSAGRMEPLTTALLESHGLRPRDVRWRVHVGNHKVYRRTGVEKDKVEASVATFSDHKVHVHRDPKEYIPDNGVDSRLVTYEDLFRDWQGKLKFIVGGNDSD